MLQVQRQESCSINLCGRSEFEASNVTLQGNQSFDVPNGFKMTVSAGAHGTIKEKLEPLQPEPSWEWKYTMGLNKNIHLQMEKASSMLHRDMLTVDPAPLSYII